ncbi:hypothetical protein Droror1_Dr00003047 [Drosera rotundifolia]
MIHRSCVIMCVQRWSLFYPKAVSPLQVLFSPHIIALHKYVMIMLIYTDTYSFLSSLFSLSHCSLFFFAVSQTKHTFNFNHHHPQLPSITISTTNDTAQPPPRHRTITTPPITITINTFLHSSSSPHEHWRRRTNPSPWPPPESHPHHHAVTPSPSSPPYDPHHHHQRQPHTTKPPPSPHTVVVPIAEPYKHHTASTTNAITITLSSSPSHDHHRHNHLACHHPSPSSPLLHIVFLTVKRNPDQTRHYPPHPSTITTCRCSHS